MRKSAILAVVLSNIVMVGAIAGAAVLDREVLHWYQDGPPAPSATATPQPDRVVGVVLRCSSSRTGTQYTGDICRGKVEAWQEITVRTAGGTTYTISVSATQYVSIGQLWP